MTERLFTIPKVYPTNHDLKKSWFVGFRYVNPKTGERRQFQLREDINAYPTIRERMAKANALAEALHEMLREGWNPYENELAQPKKESPLPLLESIDRVMEVVRTTLTEKSWITYRDMRNQFAKWLVAQGYDKMLPARFDAQRARAYMDYCLTERHYSGKTHNVHLGFLITLFNRLKSRQVVESNPFSGIKELPEKMNESVAFTDDERNAVRNHLKESNIRLYYAVQFVYYCFTRRTELSQLRVRDIDLERKTIRISGRSAKNGRSESATIPKSFEPILREMELDKLPPHYYVFGKGLLPGAERLKRVDDFTDAHREELKKIGIRKGCTFYSWKHTGAMNLYKATKDVYVVMRQCRHTDISTTMIYLRSLGLIVDEVVRNAEFEF